MVLAMALTATVWAIDGLKEIDTKMPSIFQQAVGKIENKKDNWDIYGTDITINDYPITVGENIDNIDNTIWYLSDDTKLICPLNGTDVKECKKVDSVG